jgi:hypothetical protein
MCENYTWQDMTIRMMRKAGIINSQSGLKGKQVDTIFSWPRDSEPESRKAGKPESRKSGCLAFRISGFMSITISTLNLEEPIFLIAQGFLNLILSNDCRTSLRFWWL